MIYVFQALTLCGVLLFLYGLLSSVAPSFGWLLFLRGLVGFAIGCVPQSVTLYAEFLPTKQRAKCVVLLDVSDAFLSIYRHVNYIMQILVFLGTWCLLRSCSSISSSPDFGMEMVVGPFCGSVVCVCYYNSGKYFQFITEVTLSWF